MTINEAKKELNSYLMMETSKKELQEWLDYQKYDNKMTATLSAEPKGTPKHHDQMIEKLAKGMDAEPKIQKQINEMSEKQEKIMNKILELELPYKTILFSIYVSGKTLDATALSVNYSRSQLVRLKDKGTELYSKIKKA